ncbi:MAG: 5-formyltetrahydrofolate cyclo-ligase [Victivallaceae bacterium]
MSKADKKNLRQHYRALRREFAAQNKSVADASIRQRIRELAAWRECEWIALYAADAEEPSLLELVAEPGKRFMLPRFDAARGEYEFAEIGDPVRDLRPGKFGMDEPGPQCPVPPAGVLMEKTLYLVPGVAFDRSGGRLGRGGGFYDRLLAEVKSPVCGVFYQVQLADQALAQAAHDRRMDFGVTEQQMLDFHHVNICR